VLVPSIKNLIFDLGGVILDLSVNHTLEAFSKISKMDLDDRTIDTCWNAMLRGIPPVKLELLLRLQSEFQVYLLSNTNGIHLHHINAVMLPKINGAKALDTYFHKAYYSHHMGKRKPNSDIFEQVIEENHLVPEQTLFLDDNAMNIEGAKSVGLKTIHVTSPDLILDYFHA